MKVFIGILLATTFNFLMGLLGLYFLSSFFNTTTSNDLSFNLSTFELIFSFCSKFLVIVLLTWILHKVMPLLDKPRKRVLFIFFLGSVFSIYYEFDSLLSEMNYAWTALVIAGESFNWLITGYVLSKFIKPKHLGAL